MTAPRYTAANARSEIIALTQLVEAQSARIDQLCKALATTRRNLAEVSANTPQPRAPRKMPTLPPKFADAVFDTFEVAKRAATNAYKALGPDRKYVHVVRVGDGFKLTLNDPR